MIKSWTEEKVEELKEELQVKDALGVLRWIVQNFRQPRFSSSMGQEDQVILHMLATDGLAIPAFTLDTGRLFPATYTLIAETEAQLGVRIQIQFPDAREVETMVAEEGINLFRKSVELRKRCCGVRKVQPLQRALQGADGWVCGLRQEQSPTRSGLRKLEWDPNHGIPKINPLADWTLAQVADYLAQHNVPTHPLHSQGFPSIGCACCTRAVMPGGDSRAGRWWWETPGHKECGLHIVDGKLVRYNPLETPDA